MNNEPKNKPKTNPIFYRPSSVVRHLPSDILSLWSVVLSLVSVRKLDIRKAFGYNHLTINLYAFIFGVDMLANATVADLLRPCEKSRALLYDIVLIVAGSFIIAICAQLAIGWPVPITGQTFAVLMLGALLGSRRGSLCVLTYILEGLAGLPVFAHGRGGFAVLISPTGGYLIGFVAAACIVGLLAEKGWDRRVGTTIFAMLVGNVAIYAFGLLWLSLLMGINRTVLAVGLYPFIIGDILKTVLAAILLPAGWKLIGHFGSADSSGRRPCRSPDKKNHRQQENYRLSSRIEHLASLVRRSLGEGGSIEFGE